MKQDEIDFEISTSCSGGLNSSIREMGWEEQETFSLPIKKGPIFLLLERLVPDCICLLHIGCSSDNREPSFEHKIKYGKLGQEMLIFSYIRTLYPRICLKENWFHNDNKNRNLFALAEAMSNTSNYREEICLSLFTKNDNHLMQSTSLRIDFDNNALHFISGLTNLQIDNFKEKIIGFEGSILDLTNGPLKKEKRMLSKNPIGSKEMSIIYEKYGIDIYDIIEESYKLFQSSAPKFGERMKSREPLLIYKQ